MQFELSDTVRRDVERALAERSAVFTTFPDGATALITGEQSVFYVLVFPGPDGAQRARETLTRMDALRDTLSIEIAQVWMDCTPLARNGEGALLLQAAPPDRCAPLATVEAMTRDRILATVRSIPHLAAVAADDVWVLSPDAQEHIPIIVRTERITDTP